MNKLFILMIGILLFLPAISSATPFLACDIPAETIVASEVEIDGGIVVGNTQINTDSTAMLLLDLEGFPSGRHTFRARFQDASGWWSDWSDPLDAGKPAIPGNLKIITE